MLVELQPIVPPERFRPKAFQEAIEDALVEEMADIDALFQQIISTWSDPPVVNQELKVSHGGISGSVWVDDKRMFFLNEGTRIRHAVMSNPYVTKTRVGMIQSRSGRGKVLAVSRKIRRPGIDARNWDELIVKKRRIPYTVRMAKAMAVGAKRSLFG